MEVWGGYRLRDFLLFAPRTYWRLFELENQALWPLHVPVLAAALAVLVLLFRPRPWSSRAIAALLAAGWAWVGLGFVGTRYAAINWAAAHAVPGFVLQALALLLVGTLAGRLHLAAGRSVTAATGLALYAYAVALHPLTALLSGRPLAGAEVVGIAPDPTAIATLGLLTLAAPAWGARLLLVVPLLWCAASGLTLLTMQAWEGWIPLAAAAVALSAQVWSGIRSWSAEPPRESGRGSRTR
ncbi:MAG TPA: DUF6064 family protein [Thermohalobaculum sp.]|nr:DUF6064 family protein [Thermohalobaculum sp.]